MICAVRNSGPRMRSMSKDKELDDILSTDGIRQAEAVTGKSYKEDEQTSALSFLLHMEAGRTKKKALKARGDTYRNQPFSEHCALVEGYGFELVFEESYQNDQGHPEWLRLYCHREKALLYDVHTYNAPYEGDGGREWPQASGGSLHACVQLNGEPYVPVRGGGWNPVQSQWDILGPVGYITLYGDEALLHKLRQIDESKCDFVSPWPTTMKHGLTRDGDTPKDLNPYANGLSDTEKRTRHVKQTKMRVEASLRRIAQLPRWVRELCPFEPFDIDRMEQ